ncbi:MAG: thymidine phosphorylase [Myxococcales bacterium]|nr:thymidine phosphorylase [Myxococcales bacterium]USN51175.1 MAG: thymidine phosphorylase [Myxococcales bacterium]
MQVIEIIQKKRDLRPLLKKEINFLIEHYVKGDIPNYQMSAFLMAVCINGMNEEEISYLTDAMLYSGEVISHLSEGQALIDKHSTGGVGDKISIPLAPAIAACGVKVPMIAGRGLGHTGGTLDKLESIPGFRCNLSSKQYQAQVQEIGCVIMGQTKDIAPADKMIYALRDVTGTVESIPLIASSIMSKKLAEGIDGLVLDVKFGSGAFMKDIEQSRTLASTMVALGAHMGKKVTACLTNMDQPLGVMIGNSLEIIESIDILHGRGPKDSQELTVELGAEMLLLAKKASSLEEGRKLVEQSLSSGRALDKFIEMVKAQGGDTKYIIEPKNFRPAQQKIVIKSKNAGYICEIDSRFVGLAAGLLGGGRTKLTDEINPSVGIEMHVKIGDHVDKDQVLCTLHADQKGIEEATLRLESAISIVPQSVTAPLLCQERLSTN